MPIDRAREGSCLQKPESGWTHDDRGLKAGRGVYYSFPVKYLGNMELTSSLRSLSVDDQTDLIRHAIVTVATQSGIETRPVESSAIAGFGFGAVTPANVESTINLSATGIIIAPPGYTGQEDDVYGDAGGFLEYHPVRLTSTATGGEHEVYECFSYVAKDPDTKKRCAYVCEAVGLVDEVLATFGQIFELAAEMAASKKATGAKAPKQVAASEYLDVKPEYSVGSAPVVVVDEPFQIPEEQLYDEASAQYLETGDEPVYGDDAPIYDEAKAPGGEVDDVAAELMALMQEEQNTIYSSKDAVLAADLPSPTKLVTALNTRDPSIRRGISVELNRTSSEEISRPSWVYFKPAAEGVKKMDIEALQEFGHDDE